MQIARVIGTVVSTQKHGTFEGAKLLLVQPVSLDDSPRGTPLLAVDSVGAGVHEKVLIVLEGRAAGEALGRKAARARASGHCARPYARECGAGPCGPARSAGAPREPRDVSGDLWR
ncbi:MAG: hypothetical protein DMF87_03310 [Acidobacteria bacterium]|nr:MAG: hypothetical protein DMF87_03310 [Acidobacteriota bacterium]